ncbi:MAG: toxin-antitoxin system YwqK family antitoxin [Bacteroidetes bacterium]|nr:toxin-antitoxin system YwqK family antitoxin [Bacteroidota bacterium]
MNKYVLLSCAPVSCRRLHGFFINNAKKSFLIRIICGCIFGALGSNKNYILLLLSFHCLLAFSQTKQSNVPDTANINRTDSLGLKTGLWKKYDENGKLLFMGYFREDKPIDLVRHYYANGKLKVDMIFYDNNKAASSHFYYEDGKLKATGIYRQEKRDSIWRFYDPDGFLISTETWSMGFKNGHSTAYYSNGKTAAEKFYRMDLLNGPFAEYFDTGIPKSKSKYLNGALHGEIKYYYPSGKLRTTGLYNNNASDSVWTYFNEDGSILYRKKFRMGILLNEEEINEIEKKLEEDKIKKGEYREFKEGEIDDKTIFKDAPGGER